jgi:hypothetical protein
MNAIIYTYSALQARYGHIFQLRQSSAVSESPRRCHHENVSPRHAKQQESCEEKHFPMHLPKREPLSQISGNLQNLHNETHILDNLSAGIYPVKTQTPFATSPKNWASDNTALYSDNVTLDSEHDVLGNQNFDALEGIYSIPNTQSATRALGDSCSPAPVSSFSVRGPSDIPIIMETSHVTAYSSLSSVCSSRDIPVVYESSRPTKSQFTLSQDHCWQSYDGAIVFRCPPPHPVFSNVSNRSESMDEKYNNNLRAVSPSPLKLHKTQARPNHRDSPRKRILLLR